MDEAETNIQNYYAFVGNGGCMKLKRNYLLYKLPRPFLTWRIYNTFERKYSISEGIG